jgi:hypothetical protein
MSSLDPTSSQHCPSCGKRLTTHEHFSGGQCHDWQCRLRRSRARRRVELAARWQAMRDAAAQGALDAAAAEAPVVVVRRYVAALEPVPASQRDELRKHLLSLQAEVDRLAAEPPRDDPPEETGHQVDEPTGVLLAHVCARCTGYCCRLGNGRQAFLDAPALLAARQDAPGRSHAEVVESYLAAIPPLHHVDSCAFHAADGCALPRERRAAICNSYLCPGLEQVQTQSRERDLRHVFVVRHDDETDACDGGFAPPLPSGPSNSGS